MKNPWEEIPLADYENHMQLASVVQLQTMNAMMKQQLQTYPVSSIMLLGIAGGNGLEHIDQCKVKKVYGVDINEEYLNIVKQRYQSLSGILECIQIDLVKETRSLPKAELLIANLLIEYIGYEAFQNVIKQVQPSYVSCIIQINMEGNWVSDSPYIQVFDRLNEVHHQMEEKQLRQVLKALDYQYIKTREQNLPNGKRFLQLDFKM